MDKFLLTNEQLERCKKIIGNSIKELMIESNSTGCVLGLSGGLDSSIVLKLAVDSGINVHALILPEEGITEPEDIIDAEELCREFRVEYDTIQIDNIIAEINKKFPYSKFDSNKKRISMANVKPRVRMLLNYLVANLDNRIVIGTSNRSEILLGYVTKYGDNAADIEPIGGLYKTQVKQLARYVNLSWKIINKTPSAGLWRGQTDKEELGADYEKIDEILYCLIDKQYSIEETMEKTDISFELIKKIYERIEKNKHKRTMPKIPKLFYQT